MVSSQKRTMGTVGYASVDTTLYYESILKEMTVRIYGTEAMHSPQTYRDRT